MKKDRPQKQISPNTKAFMRTYLKTKAPWIFVTSVFFGAVVGAGYWLTMVHPSWEKALELRIKYNLKSEFSPNPKTHAAQQEIERIWKANFSSTSNVSFFLGLVTAAGVFGGSLGILRRKVLERLEPRYLRGVRIVSTKEQQKEIKKKIGAGGTNVIYTPFDLRIGKENVRVPVALGNDFWGLIGDSGTGKSNFIRKSLLQIRSHSEKVFIFDPNGEFYSQFGKDGDHILSLYDNRAEFWDFWVENFEPLTIAASLIEDRGKGGGDQTGFWTQAGQLLIAALLRKCQTQHELWDHLQKPWSELYFLLKAESDIAAQLVAEPKFATSTIGSASAELYFLQYLNYHATLQGRTKPFSIKKWVGNNEERSWVFVTVMDGQRKASRELVRMWFDLCINSLFERGEQAANVPIHIICDEFETLGKMPSLVSLLSRGRKYKGSLQLGMQARSQLDGSFGKDIAATILQGLQNVLFFRSSDGDMAEYASKQLGEQEVEVTTYVTAVSKDGENISTSTHVGKRRNILPDEIRSLPDMTGYLWLAQEVNPSKITLEHLILPRINNLGEKHCVVPPAGIHTLRPDWEERKAELEAAAKHKVEGAQLKEKVEKMKLEEDLLKIENMREQRDSSGPPTKQKAASTNHVSYSKVKNKSISDVNKDSKKGPEDKEPTVEKKVELPSNETAVVPGLEKEAMPSAVKLTVKRY